MDKNHQASIVKVLVPYAVAWPQSKINDATYVIYARALSCLSLTQIDAAMLKLMRTSKFFPTIAEIFEQVENIQHFARGTDAPTADEAWGEAMRLAHDKSVYGKWEYSCEAVKIAVKRFGKNELCCLETDNVNTARAQFMRIYESVIKQHKDKKINKSVLKALPKQTVKALVYNLADKMDIENLPVGKKGA